MCELAPLCYFGTDTNYRQVGIRLLVVQSRSPSAAPVQSGRTLEKVEGIDDDTLVALAPLCRHSSHVGM